MKIVRSDEEGEITEPERCEGDPNTAQKDEKNKGEHESNVPSKHRS